MSQTGDSSITVTRKLSKMWKRSKVTLQSVSLITPKVGNTSFKFAKYVLHLEELWEAYSTLSP